MFLAEKEQGGVLGCVITSLYTFFFLASQAKTAADVSSVFFSVWSGISDRHVKISPSFWLFDDREKRWLIITHPSHSLAVEVLLRGANPGKNHWKLGLGSNLMERGENEERRNELQGSNLDCKFKRKCNSTLVPSWRPVFILFAPWKQKGDPCIGG